MWPVVSCSLFLNIQEVTLLLETWENTPCLHMQISTTSLPGYAHIFLSIFVAHLRVYVCRMVYERSFMSMLKTPKL